MSRPHRIVAVVYDGFQPLDLSGPMEVVVGATTAGVQPPYRFEVACAGGGTVRSDSGLVVVADRSIESLAAPGAPSPSRPGGRPGPGLPPEPGGAADQGADPAIDTLLVVGGDGAIDAAADDGLVAMVADLAARAERVTSVCSGALVLAATGLLDGRRATTHWTAAGELARRSEVSVDADRLWVRDGHVWTSAGVTAGIDLFLAIVEHDHGPDVARLIARHLVVFSQRPGGQDQFSTHLRARPARSQPIRDLQRWIPNHLAGDLTVAALAGRVGVSPRTLSRRFRDEVGASPAAFVEAARVEAAKQLLESTDLTVDTVARRVGFGHGETLHRAFCRRVGTTPARYRMHFATEASGAEPPASRAPATPARPAATPTPAATSTPATG